MNERMNYYREYAVEWLEEEETHKQKDRQIQTHTRRQTGRQADAIKLASFPPAAAVPSSDFGHPAISSASATQPSARNPCLATAGIVNVAETPTTLAHLTVKTIGYCC